MEPHTLATPQAQPSLYPVCILWNETAFGTLPSMISFVGFMHHDCMYLQAPQLHATRKSVQMILKARGSQAPGHKSWGLRQEALVIGLHLHQDGLGTRNAELVEAYCLLALQADQTCLGMQGRHGRHRKPAAARCAWTIPRGQPCKQRPTGAAVQRFCWAKMIGSMLGPQPVALGKWGPGDLLIKKISGFPFEWQIANCRL